jgi:hypothetical protein
VAPAAIVANITAMSARLELQPTRINRFIVNTPDGRAFFFEGVWLGVEPFVDAVEFRSRDSHGHRFLRGRDIHGNSQVGAE